jgi:hypothetical protein
VVCGCSDGISATAGGLRHVVSGAGAYEGWEGGGEMEIKYDRGSDTKGNETFKGNHHPDSDDGPQGTVQWGRSAPCSSHFLRACSEQFT